MYSRGRIPHYPNHALEERRAARGGNGKSRPLFVRDSSAATTKTTTMATGADCECASEISGATLLCILLAYLLGLFLIFLITWLLWYCFVMKRKHKQYQSEYVQQINETDSIHKGYH